MATITLSLVLLDGTRAWSDDAVETIVLVRHGEKPDKGLGQLDCQGLNRALALTPVIAKTFGRPSAIFAPDPSRQKQDDGASYDYVRPLATIEPTAIFFRLPVNASQLLPELELGASGAKVKAYEDALDAAVCAWVAICALRGRAKPFGDHQSAIWVPVQL